MIAERSMTIVRDGAKARGFVRLHAPELDAGAWWCAVHVAWPGFEQKRRIAGVDSYQALLLAMKFVPTLVSLSDEFRDGSLREFDGEEPLSDLASSFGFGPYEGKPQ